MIDNATGTPVMYAVHTDHLGTPRIMTPGWTPESLARHTQTVFQGAFILAKATGEAETARESADHLKRYIELLFGVGNTEG